MGIGGGDTKDDVETDIEGGIWSEGRGERGAGGLDRDGFKEKDKAGGGGLERGTGSGMKRVEFWQKTAMVFKPHQGQDH